MRKGQKLCALLLTLGLSMGLCTSAQAGEIQDVPDKHWASSYIQKILERGLMDLNEDNMFCPDEATNRITAVKAIYFLEEIESNTYSDTFSDVSEEDRIFVNWAAGLGIVEGYNKELFGPEDSLTREQLVVLLYRYAQKMGYTAQHLPSDAQRIELNSFLDHDKVATWATESMNWALEMELISGMGDKSINPKGRLTRSQLAAILIRFIDMRDKIRNEIKDSQQEDYQENTQEELKQQAEYEELVIVTNGGTVSTSLDTNYFGETIVRTTYSVRPTVVGGDGYYLYSFQLIQYGQVVNTRSWSEDNTYSVTMGNGRGGSAGSCMIRIIVKDGTGRTVYGTARFGD